MGRVSSWDTTVPCPMWVKSGATKKFETEDIILPSPITEDQVQEFPDHISETYEECAGDVRCKGYYDSGNISGLPENCYPPEGESEVYPCDTCGFDKWTDKQRMLLEEHAENG